MLVRLFPGRHSDCPTGFEIHQCGSHLAHVLMLQPTVPQAASSYQLYRIREAAVGLNENNQFVTRFLVILQT
jgi:hypothetical protein